MKYIIHRIEEFKGESKINLPDGRVLILKEEIKMTREEAIEKLSPGTKYGYSPDALCDALEALGLIKFEKPALKETYRYATNEGDIKFLNWLYSRLLNVYKENPNVDYMRTLKKFADDWK